MVDFTTLSWLQPEILLIATASAVFVAGAFVAPNRGLWSAVATAALAAAAGILVLREWAAVTTGFTGPLTIDLMGQLIRLLAVAAGLLLVLLASGTLNRRLPAEYVGSLLVVVAGVMLAARANDLVLLFVSLELVSIPTYVLLFIGRRGRAAAESTAKYFFLSILSSALMLYGFSFLYGLAGTTTLAGEESIRSALAAESDSLMGFVALVLVLAGLGFKVAAAPFHFYAPDVYQGASNAVAGLLATAPKIAGMAALLRLGAAWPADPYGWKVVAVLSLVTMTIGNVGALWQRHLRRLLAYSSIAHAGYMLIGLAVLLAADYGRPSYGGASALILYLATYVLASLGAFATAVLLGSEGQEVDGIDELAGLGRTRPAVALAMAVMMFSLAGVPPLAGFWGKLTLLTGAVSMSLTTEAPDVQWWFVALAVGGAVNAAIAAAYYLRVVGVMYFRPVDASPPAAGGPGATVSLAACAAAVVLLSIMPGLVLEPAGAAELQWSTTAQAQTALDP